MRLLSNNKLIKNLVYKNEHREIKKQYTQEMLEKQQKIGSHSARTRELREKLIVAYHCAIQVCSLYLERSFT
jgi:hypothetical protein